MNERWKPVKGYEGLYEVSDHGRVRSLNFHRKTGRVKVLAINRCRKYPYVCLWPNKKTCSVHVLVLEAFVGQRPAGLVCDHIDGRKSNNRLDNLRWTTQRVNVTRGCSPALSSTRSRGERNVNAKVTDSDVAAIRVKYAEGGTSQRRLAEEFGISQPSVNAIVKHVTWRHVA